MTAKMNLAAGTVTVTCDGDCNQSMTGPAAHPDPTIAIPAARRSAGRADWAHDTPDTDWCPRCDPHRVGLTLTPNPATLELVDEPGPRPGGAPAPVLLTDDDDWGDVPADR